MPLYRFVLVHAYIPRAYFGEFVPEVSSFEAKGDCISASVKTAISRTEEKLLLKFDTVALHDTEDYFIS